MCVGRCKYKFYATKINHHIDEEKKLQTEKTLEGIVLCETCAHSQDIEFDE